MNFIKAPLLAFLAYFALTGCSPVVVGGAAVGGVKAATDERTIGRLTDDAVLTARVKTVLIKDEEVMARKIDVDTLNGVVTLSGLVESEAVSRRAEALAAQVEGVVRVRNNLQVGSRTLRQAMDDSLLGTRIKGRLLQEPSIRALNIDVDVIKRVAYLRGLVGDQKQKRKALDLAATTPGVERVVDQLRISGD